MRPFHFVHVFYEAVSNLTRNATLTITSIITVFLTLVLAGVFGLVILTISYNANNLADMMEIKVFIEPEADDLLVEQIGQQIASDNRVAEIVYISKQEAFQTAKEIVDESILQDMGYEFLPSSYVVKLHDYTYGEQFAAFVRGIPQVYRVIYHSESIQFTTSFTQWIRYLSGALSIFLAILTIFLVSNTIKLTVVSRREEVAIMKYIGATESRIKMPFITEGAIMGFIGAMIAVLTVSYGYSRLYYWFSMVGYEDVFFSGIHMIPVQQVIAITMFAFIVCGILLGTTGSLLAIRKHLKV